MLMLKGMIYSYAVYNLRNLSFDEYVILIHVQPGINLQNNDISPTKTNT